MRQIKRVSLFRFTRFLPRDERLRRIAGEYSYQQPMIIRRMSVEYGYLCTYLFPDAPWTSLDNATREVDKFIEADRMGRLKLSRALKRISKDFDYNNLVTQKAGRGRFVVSVRYNDILRCSVSGAFSSCFAPDGSNRHIPATYLDCPGIAIAFVRDKAGHFKSRVFLYLLKDGRVVVGCPYGQMNLETWMSTIKGAGIECVEHGYIGAVKYVDLAYPHPPGYSDMCFLPARNTWGVDREKIAVVSGSETGA